MTDHPPPDDEIVSALLDGAATPDEAAAVEASAPARARRDQLQAVRALVGEPVVSPAGARDGAVAAALAVFDDEVIGSRPTDRAADPPSLAARRSRRARPLLPVLGAVASVLLVLVVAAGLRLASGGDGASMTAGQSPAEDATTGGAVAPTAAGPGQGSEPGAETNLSAERPTAASGTGGGVTDLGVVADGPGLRRAVAAALTTPPPPPPMAPTSGGAEADARSSADDAADPRACDAVRRAAEPSLGALVLVGTAHFGGEPLGVLAYRAEPAGPVRTYLSAPATCRVVLVDPG